MKKKRKKVLNKGVEARRAARNSAAKPAATRVIIDKRKRSAKHKRDILQDSSSL